MLLDMIILGLVMPGIGLIAFGYIVQGAGEKLGILAQLPWGLVGAMMMVLAIGVIRWRGKVSTAWAAVDFPTPGQKIGVSLQGASMMFERVLPSIAGFLNANNTGRYYKDDPDGSYGGFGGHDVRLIDREVAYCASPEKALLIESLSKDGFYDWKAVEDAVKTKMVNLKQNGVYLLTGSDDIPNILDIDIVNNQAHKELFEYLCNNYFMKVHGRVYSLKNYHRFQERQAAPIQVGIIIYYAKALAAMRAARVKQGMGSGIWKIIGIVVLIIAILAVLFLIGTGTIQMPSGMIPGAK